MNPFNHMTPDFQEDNREALNEALYNKLVGIDQPDTLGDCIETGLNDLGSGIAWAGFWIGCGIALIGAWK